MLLVQFAMCNTHSHTHTSSVTFHVVFMHQLCGSSPECNHPSLHTHSLQLGPIEVISASGQLLKVHVRADIHLSGMYSQDVCPCFLSGQWKFNLAVQTTWIRKKMEVPCSKRMCMTDKCTLHVAVMGRNGTMFCCIFYHVTMCKAL